MPKLYEAVRVRGARDNHHAWTLGYWERIAVDKCRECGNPLIEVQNTDPGSVEEAIGVRTLCSTCWENPEVDPFY